MGLQIGALHVRRSNLAQANPIRVWEEFTSFDRLAAWFGQGHKLESYDPRLGGHIRFSVELEGTVRFFGGEIIVFEPGRELSISDNWEIEPWPVPTFITIRLTSLYDGCHIELFHHGFERLGDTAFSELQGYEAGWHTRHLDTLRQIVES